MFLVPLVFLRPPLCLRPLSSSSKKVSVCCGCKYPTPLSFFSFFSTQNLQTFQSLSCTGFFAADSRQSSLTPPNLSTPGQPDSDFTGVQEPGLKSWHEADANEEEEEEEEDSSYEELDSDSACSVDSGPVGGRHTLWKGDGSTKRDVLQLGGELDLDQIERN